MALETDRLYPEVLGTGQVKTTPLLVLEAPPATKYTIKSVTLANVGAADKHVSIWATPAAIAAHGDLTTAHKILDEFVVPGNTTYIMEWIGGGTTLKTTEKLWLGGETDDTINATIDGTIKT